MFFHPPGARKRLFRLWGMLGGSAKPSSLPLGDTQGDLAPPPLMAVEKLPSSPCRPLITGGLGYLEDTVGASGVGTSVWICVVRWALPLAMPV